MDIALPLPEAQAHLGELVARAHQDRERFVVTENGQPAAVLISVDELGELQQAQEQADIALCETIKARNETGLTHEQFMASFDAAEVPRS
jgi:prevent-host-death family protein